MSLRARLFIIVSLVAIVILAVSLILWNNARQKRLAGGGSSTSTSVNDTSSFKVIDANNFDIPSNPSTSAVSGGQVTLTPEQIADQSLEQLAKIFVERYGTYSSDNNFQNIKEVQDMVTPALWALIKPTDVKRSGGFVGVTTQAITSEFVKKNAGEVIVKVKTVRIEEKNNKISNLQQSGVVTLIKQGSGWLIDKIVWEK
jgi:hypothetical protein